MEENTTQIFKYLTKNKISIDQIEFQFQYESHPDYPSLLALSDTLKFFKIDNGAFKISEDDLDQIPENFLAVIQKEGESEDFSNIQKVKEGFNVNEQYFSKEDFLKIFKNIVLIAEKSESFVSQKSNQFQPYLLGCMVLLLGLPAFLNGSNIWSVLFYLFAVVGVYLAFETFKQSLGVNSGLTSKFCNATPQTSCESVVKSNKWKIFEKISLSDISLMFFLSQLFLIALFSLTDSFQRLINFSAYFMWLALPVSLLSLYYQKFVEKKWCPICLGIIGVLTIETIMVCALSSFKISALSIYSSVIIAVTIILVSLGWYFIKEVLTKSNNQQNELSKSLRFKRNYQLFKDQLLKTEKLVFPKNNQSIYFGSETSKCQIAVFTSPFCGHCKKVHELLNELYQTYQDKIGIHILYSIDITRETPSVNVIKRLQQLFLKEGLQKYEEEVRNFYNKENYTYEFFKNTDYLAEEQEITELLKIQNTFANENQINFTPMIFINGYKFPDIYEREDLVYFINDLIEDSI